VEEILELDGYEVLWWSSDVVEAVQARTIGSCREASFVQNSPWKLTSLCMLVSLLIIVSRWPISGRIIVN
jgi:hypothetical protein